MQRRAYTAFAMLSVCLMLATQSFSQSDQNAQASRPAHENAPGKMHMQGVRVPFNAGMRDKDGHVIPAVPDVSKFEDKEEGPTLSTQGLADKAKAEAHEFNLSKPSPKVVPAGKASFLSRLPQGVSGPVFKKNTWKLNEFGPHASATPDAPFFGNSFGGISDTGTEPPDVASAAGPYQVVAASNFTVNTFDKNGNLLGSQSFASFFSPLGDPSTWFLFDPVAVYDPYIGRFWLMVTARNDSTNQSDILIAMSASSDLNFGWIFWWVDFTVDGSNPTSNWCDYPHVGIDANAIYMTCNQFNFPAPGSFQYAKVRLMLKDQFLNNTCCSWWDHWNLHEGFLNLFTSFAVQPATMRLASGGDGEYLVDAQGGGGSGSTLQVWHFPDPVNNPAQLDSSSVGTTNYAPAPSAQQPFGVTAIDTGDARLLFATWEFGHLSVGQNSSCGSNSCAAFYEVDVSSFPNNLNTVNDWALQAGGVDYYYPGADQNFNADKTFVYTRSSPSEFAGSNYVGIPNSSTCTLCINGPETSLAAGNNTYSRICCGNRNRWGDYFSASADPDGLGIWISGEFVAAQDTWGTQIGATYNGYAPFASLSNTSINFGGQAIFSTSLAQAEFITNTGNATMVLSGVSVSGDPNFFVVFDSCSFRNLQPGFGCEVDVEFSPTSVGGHSANLIVPYNTFFQSSATINGTGLQAGTSTAISSSLNPSTFGQAVKFTASVVSLTAGTPTGTVTFKDGSTALGTVSLSGGVASFTATALGGGVHTITAVYNGSTNYLSSSAALSQTVHPATTSSSLVSSKNPSTYGTAVTFTASVTSGVAGTISGTVTFNNGTTAIGTGTISAGKAALTISTLGGGTHSITAHYNGSANFAASTSGAVSQVVNKAATTSALASTPNPSSFGQSVKLTATVKAGSTPGVGTVTFKNGTTILGTATLNASGVATLSKANLTVGIHSLTAVYAGNANLLGTTSAVVKQTVNKATTTTKLVSSLNPATKGQSVTFTATVKPAFTGSPSGTVTFKDGTTVLGTASVSASTHQAKLTKSTLAVGTHSITAVYGGSASFLGSTSAVLKQVINP